MVSFLVDESTGRSVYQALEEDGYDAVYVGEEMEQANDSDVLAAAEEDERVLVTNDKDFGELVYRLRRPVTGVILLRLHDERPGNKVQVLRKVLEQRENQLEGYFTVVREDAVKTRKLRTEK